MDTGLVMCMYFWKGYKLWIWVHAVGKGTGFGIGRGCRNGYS